EQLIAPPLVPATLQSRPFCSFSPLRLPCFFAQHCSCGLGRLRRPAGVPGGGEARAAPPLRFARHADPAEFRRQTALWYMVIEILRLLALPHPVARALVS